MLSGHATDASSLAIDHDADWSDPVSQRDAIRAVEIRPLDSRRRRVGPERAILRRRKRFTPGLNQNQRDYDWKRATCRHHVAHLYAVVRGRTHNRLSVALSPMGTAAR